MHSTTIRVDKYIHTNKLLTDNAKVIIGVSGGADSIALLDMLHELGYECIVAHCNFHLRGQESFRDEYFVEKTANRYGMKYLSANFDTKKHIKEESISLEMAARELRYAWFEKIRKEYNAEKIAVAHHQDDSVETVLINLIRGTGIRGLTGISPSNDKVIRPLLCIYREDILDYLKDKNLDFVEDSTNKEDIYIRNKIRLNVIPLLKSINPSAVQALSRTADNLSQTEKIYNAYIENVKSKIVTNQQINIELLLREKEPKTVLFEILYPYGFNAATIDNIFESIEGQSGKIFYSDGYQLIKDRESFILEPLIHQQEVTYTLEDNTTNIKEPISLAIEILENKPNIEILKNKNIIYLDKSKITFPLTIRRWEQGDKFIPFGMKGHKKVSDYFSDHKFSLVDKNNTWLLCSSDKIIWIIGERMDDRFKITNKTSEILKITLSNNEPIK